MDVPAIKVKQENFGISAPFSSGKNTNGTKRKSKKASSGMVRVSPGDGRAKLVKTIMALRRKMVEIGLSDMDPKEKQLKTMELQRQIDAIEKMINEIDRKMREQLMEAQNDSSDKKKRKGEKAIYVKKSDLQSENSPAAASLKLDLANITISGASASQVDLSL